MKQITILIVHSSDEMYGTDVVLLKLLHEMDLTRFRPVVVIPSDVKYDGLFTRELRSRNITTYHHRTAILRRKYFSLVGFFVYLYRLVVSIFFLTNLIRKESVDIVHSNSLAVIPGAFAAFLTRTPNLWHVHEIITSPKLLWRLTSWLVPRLSRTVVAVSHATRQHLCSGSRLNEKKCIVIHNGIGEVDQSSDTGAREKIRTEWGVTDDQIVIGMVGRFNDWKGQGYLVQVARHVLELHPDARFVMVGGTFPGQEYMVDLVRERILEYNLQSYIILNGFRSDIPDVLDAFDIFVLPSTRPDPLPTVVLEAMATGKPVVANAHGGSVEMVVDGKTGYLVQPDKSEVMAQAVCRLIRSSELRTKFGIAGRERIRDTFSLDSYVHKWLTLYRENAR
jgi:glycosyltransferase involved in cell wall biosynthesis